MYGIFTYIYHKNEPNVGKYTSFMDPMGMAVKKNITHQGLVFVAFLQADAVSTFSGSDGLREICDLTGAGGEIVGCRGCVGRCGGYHPCPKNPGLRYREDGTGSLNHSQIDIPIQRIVAQPLDLRVFGENTVALGWEG